MGLIYSRFLVNRNTQVNVVPDEQNRDTSIRFFDDSRYRSVTLPKGTILILAGQSRNGHLDIDEYKVLNYLESKVPVEWFFTRTDYLLSVPGVDKVDFVELFVPFEDLPKFLNKKYFYQDIIEWRLSKGV